MGFLADFLSRTVLVGFLSGVGVSGCPRRTEWHVGYRKGRTWICSPGPVHLPALGANEPDHAVHRFSGCKHYRGIRNACAPLPGALLAVIGMTAASAFFDWAHHGIRVVGVVPRG